jgi:hypothetical protein
VPWARVLGHLAGRSDRQEGYGEEVRLVLCELEVAPPDRLEASDRADARVGVVHPLHLVQHPASKFPPRHPGDLREERLAIGKMAVHGGRRDLEPTSDFAKNDGVGSAGPRELDGLGHERPGQVAVVVALASRRFHRSCYVDIVHFVPHHTRCERR